VRTADTAVRVREVEPGDADALRRLRADALTRHPAAYATADHEEAALTPADWLVRATPTPQATIWLAEGEGGALAGLAGIRGDGRARTGHVAELWGVYVAPDHRGRGVGDALVGAAVRWARGQGFARIRLNVDTENAGAARLYLRHGFVVHGREPDVIRVGEDRRDEYLMHLVLR